MARHIPRSIRHKHLPSPKVRALANWDREIKAVALEATNRTCATSPGRPRGSQAGLFDEVLRVAARRGRKSDTILDVWPRSRMLTGGGVRYVGRSVPYIDIHNAPIVASWAVSIAWTIQRCCSFRNGIFYEFVPLDALDNGTPEQVPHQGLI